MKDEYPPEQYWICNSCDEEKSEVEPQYEWRDSYICQSCMELLADQEYERMKEGE